MSNQLEEIMIQLGTGPWNLLHYFGAAYGMGIPAPHGLASAFFSPRVDYTCRAPVDANITDSSCSYLVEDPASGSLEEELCTEWDFDNSTFSSTVTSEYQLVCSQEYLRPLYQSMYMFGVFTGSPINGFLADRFGRKPLVVGGSLLFTFIAISSVWLTSFSALLAARFFVGLGHSTLMKTALILCLEATAPKFRAAAGVTVGMPWAFNSIVLSGAAYLIRDWRTLQLTISLLGLLHIPLLWLMDESPRWLAVRGQHTRALEILKKAARWNKASLPPDETLLEMLKAEQEKTEASHESPQRSIMERIKDGLKSLVILFRTPRLRKITLICYLDYLVVAMVYFGLALGGTSFGGNVFTYMALMALVEIPPYGIVVYQVSAFGRRATTAIDFMISGVVVLAVFFVPSDLTWLRITLALLGKMANSCAFCAINIFATELFPTEVRTRGVNTSFMVSRVGAMAAPFITDLLGLHYPWSPPVVFGVAGVVASLGTLMLPETMGVALPDTVAHLESRKEDAETRCFFRRPTKGSEYTGNENPSYIKSKEDPERRDSSKPEQEEHKV